MARIAKSLSTMPTTGMPPLVNQAADTAPAAAAATTTLRATGSARAAMPIAGNTPRNPARLPCTPTTAAAPPTAMSSVPSRTAGRARGSHIAATVAPQNAISAIATPTAVPPAGEGLARNDVVTTNTITAAASTRIHRKAVFSRPWARCSSATSTEVTSEFTPQRYGAAPRPSRARGWRFGWRFLHPRVEYRPPEVQVQIPSRRRCRAGSPRRRLAGQPRPAKERDGRQYRRARRRTTGRRRRYRGAGDQRERPGQELRQPRSRSGHRSRRTARGDLRIPRAERRGQDHDGGDTRGLPPAHRGRDRRARGGPGPGRRSLAGPDRRRPAGVR